MNRTALFVAGIVCLATSSSIVAAPPDALKYVPPEAWVLPPPAPAETSPNRGGPIRFTYFDTQVRIAPDGTEQDYTSYRMTIVKPEGLAAGNLTLTWSPDTGGMTVHHVQLIRNGQVTDVLATTKFTILQREARLEQSVLSGLNTATLQVPGLQIGDEIAVAVTIDKKDAGLGGRVAGAIQLPVVGVPGTFRWRILWPSDHPIRWRMSPDMAKVEPTVSGDQTALEVTLTNPTGAIPTEGAPARYNRRRLLEFSDFGSWQDVSRQLQPLFERAANLKAGSPIKAEAAAIAARTKNPAEQAEAALQLVEDRIRYVFVALNGGSYIPASADETWERKFGDCKAKTVLLMALLRELGIKAEPALVDSNGGDGLDQLLPGARAFDHVIVKATIPGKTLWLDGTRSGDRFLDNLPLPYQWALPLSAAGSTLEKLPPRDVDFPILTGIVDIDATAGVDKDARVHIRNIVRGDEAFVLQTQLAGMSAEDADRSLKSYWRQQVDWLTPDKVAWKYDDRRRAIVLEVAGLGNPGWTGDAEAGHSLTIPGAGFYPPEMLRRPSDQDQSAPWHVNFPRWRCWATTIRLPKPGPKFKWSLYAEPMNRRLGGTLYWRNSGMNGNVVRTVMSSRNYEAEVSPEEAAIVNRAIPNFNNNMSNVSEAVATGPIKLPSQQLPFSDADDWLNAPVPCSPVHS